MKKFLAIVLALFAISILFTSCSSSGIIYDYAKDSYNHVTEEYQINDTDSPGEAIEIETAETTAETYQKLIKEQYIYFETTEFDDFVKNINIEISKNKGYVQKSSISGNSYSYNNYRYAEIIARIPADNYDKFSEAIAKLGNVTEKNEYVVDVTTAYIDIESRLKALKTEEETLLKILESAETTADVITVNERLSEVRYEIENYESNLRNLENRVSYCTVTIYANEVKKETVELEDKSMFQEIKNKFSNNLYNIGQGFRSFFVWFTSSILYIIIWAVIITIIVVIIKKIIKSHKKKKSN